MSTYATRVTAISGRITPSHMDATKQSQDLLEVTASMRTALLVYGGINVKMMVDSDLGAQLVDDVHGALRPRRGHRPA